MRLSNIYKCYLKKDADGEAARSVLVAQHEFASLADFDPRSGEPMPRPMTGMLADISSDKVLPQNGLHDRLWWICDHCGQSFASLFRSLNEEPRRIHESMHVRQVRELDVQSFVKLSMRPGFNIRQKLANDPHLNAVRHVMSIDLPENRLLKACAALLSERLEEKRAVIPLSELESELQTRITSWLHSGEAATISSWTNIPPNNTLLSHRDYRRVWDAWRALERLDAETESDWKHRDDILSGMKFWKELASLRNSKRLQLAEVPVVSNPDTLSIRPFADVPIPLFVLRNGVPFGPPYKSHLLPFGGPIPRGSQGRKRMGSCGKTAKSAVCIDFTSPQPIYSADGKSASRLAQILAWQNWKEGDSEESVSIGCFHADGVWNRKDVETIVPLDAFFQDRHPSDLLDTAFRDMVSFLRAECFDTERLVWLVPDFLDDFTLGLPRRTVNASFAVAEPLPRSIAAVVTSIAYDSVKPGDSVLFLDQVSGVVFATKLEADYDAGLAKAVPKTCGIRWTRHPSVVLRDKHAERVLSSGFPTVDESGRWSFGGDSRFEISEQDKRGAENAFPKCTIRIRVDKMDVPLVCGGWTACVLQQRAGDLAIWCDKLPALSMGGVIVDGMYGDFTLVDASSQSIRPVRGQAVSIPVPELFNLPKYKAVFPLHQGEGRQAPDYVAEVDYPPQRSSTVCRLDLRYTYGADEPYSLVFIPVESGRGLPRRIHAKWKPITQANFIGRNEFTSPSFPPLKTWAELRSYPQKDGSGTTDLIARALDLLSCCDPIKMAEDNLRRKKLKLREKRIQQYHNARVSGTINSNRWGLTDRTGKRYFFVETNDGELFCHENDFRDPGVLDSLVPGSMVWFTTVVNKKTGRVQTRDIATDESLPESSLPKFLKREAWEPTVKELSDLALLVHQQSETFLADNEKRIGWRLDALRFPLIAITHGVRTLTCPDFPNDLRMAIAQAYSCLEKGFSNSTLSEEFQSKILQFFSYFHSFAPPSFQRWALQYAQTAPLWMHWRKLAYCLGDLSQEWQQEILLTLSNRLSVPADSRLILSLLGISAWRSPLFLDRTNSQTIKLMIERLPEAIAADRKRLVKSPLPNKTDDDRAKKKWFFEIEPLALHLELALALLRINPDTGARFASVLTPGSLQARNFVRWIDELTLYLHEQEISLPFRITLETKKPRNLNNTPDFLYALRCYLTGDDGANAISITSIDEGSDSYDENN